MTPAQTGLLVNLSALRDAVATIAKIDAGAKANCAFHGAVRFCRVPVVRAHRSPCMLPSLAADSGEIRLAISCGSASIR